MIDVSHSPVLLVGGSGTVGTLAARALRRLYPRLPLTLGSRHRARAEAVAESLGRADAVRVDLQRPDLGLPSNARYAAVIVFLRDDTLNTLRFAQDRGIPYLSLSTGSFEMAPEVARHIQRPSASAMLLQSHWLAGAASVPALHFAREFARVDRIDIGAVLDEQDMGGAAASADYERLTSAAPRPLVLTEGRWDWATEAGLHRSFKAVDGSLMAGQAYGPFDAFSLAAATGARSIRFDLAMGESTHRRRGLALSTEIVIEITGELPDGSPGAVRHDIVQPRGQAPLTALLVALGTERLLGLDGEPAVPAGLYLPDVVLDPARVIAQMQAFGAIFSRS